MNGTRSILTIPLCMIRRRPSRLAAVNEAFLLGYQAGCADERKLAAKVQPGSVDPVALIATDQRAAVG